LRVSVAEGAYAPGEELDRLAVLVHLHALAIKLVLDDERPALHELHHALWRLARSQHGFDGLEQARALRSKQKYSDQLRGACVVWN
jgi:hypothetical protein